MMNIYDPEYLQPIEYHMESVNLHDNVYTLEPGLVNMPRMVHRHYYVPIIRKKNEVFPKHFRSKVFYNPDGLRLNFTKFSY